MSPISALFLRAKHWQIFLVFLLAGFVDALFLALPGFETFGKFELLNAVSTAIWLAFLLGWLWSMGSFLNSIAPKQFRLNRNFFAFTVLYPAFYMVGFFYIVGHQQGPSPSLALILPFNLSVMFCLIYNLYFVAKSLIIAETQKNASFYDYAGPFFLIWFFPIGVWFTQPRINQLYERSLRTAEAQA